MIKDPITPKNKEKINNRKKNLFRKPLKNTLTIDNTVKGPTFDTTKDNQANKADIVSGPLEDKRVESIQFEKIDGAGDGDCGYTALGTARDQANLTSILPGTSRETNSNSQLDNRASNVVIVPNASRPVPLVVLLPTSQALIAFFGAPKKLMNCYITLYRTGNCCLQWS